MDEIWGGAANTSNVKEEGKREGRAMTGRKEDFSLASGVQFSGTRPPKYCPVRRWPPLAVLGLGNSSSLSSG